MAMLVLLFMVMTPFLTIIQAIPHKLPSTTMNESFASTYQLKDGEVITKLVWANYSAIETRYLHIDLIQVSVH